MTQKKPDKFQIAANTGQKIEFSLGDLFRRKPRICLHLLYKSLIKSFIACAKHGIFIHCYAVMRYILNSTFA